MAINQAKFLQPLRSKAIYDNYDAALAALETMRANLTGVDEADGISVVVRYHAVENGGAIVKSLFGIFHTGTNSFTTYSFDDKSMKELYETIDGLGDEIDALTGTTSTSGIIDTKIEAAINALDASETGEGELVKVTVEQTNGAVSNVSVDEEDLAAKFTAVEKSISDETAAREAGDKTLQDNITAAEGRIGALETAIGEGGSVEAQITAAIQELDATVGEGSVAEGKHVSVQVVEVDGKITEVNVNESDIASAAALAGVDGRLATAEGTIATLNGDENTTGSVKEQIKVAKEALQAEIDAVSAEAKSYEMVKVTGEELAALGANVQEAYQLYETVGTASTKAGEAIKIYKDTSLKSVSFADQILTFTYILADGSENVVNVDVSSFLDENEFIDGLQVVDHKVSVKIADGSEKFLTVDANGLKLSGVQTAINDTIATEVGKLDAYVTSADNEYVTVKVVETDGKITAVNVDELGLGNELDRIDSAITAETAAREADKADLEGKIASAKTDLEGQIASAKTDLEAAIEEVSDSLSAVSGSYLTNITVNGVAGSVANNMATVTVDGGDVALSTEYASVTYASVEGKTFTAAKAGDTIDAAIKAVDTNVATLLDAVLENEATTAAAITAINTAAGLSENATYTPNASANYIADATNLVDADNKLDAAIKVNADAIEETKNAAISVVAGNGIEITENGTEKTIAVKADKTVFTVEDGTLKLSEKANIDCGTF